jgi:TPR repeat protein
MSLMFPLAAHAQGSEAFEEGVAAYEDGDYETAVDLWTPLAEDGSPEAQRNLAQLYRLGLGVERDNQRAYELYAAAADKNIVEAQVNAAFLLLTGEDVEKNPQQAALWFAKAADQGDALAQFNLGLMYEKGVGVPQDRSIARELYQLSGNQGQKRALARLDAMEAALPPDGGENARAAKVAEAEAEKAKREAEERARKQQEADVKRAEAKKAAKEEEAKKSRIQKAEAEAKTGPIMMMEKVEPKADTDVETETVAKADDDGDSARADDAPKATPDARRKPASASESRSVVAKSTGPGALRSTQSARIKRVKDAEAAYARGDFSTSTRLLMPLVEEGMPVAQFWMGRMFNRGEGVKLDRFEAYSLWRSAAASGSGQAATALANLANHLTPQELARAEQYHQRRKQQMAQRAQ